MDLICTGCFERGDRTSGEDEEDEELDLAERDEGSGGYEAEDVSPEEYLADVLKDLLEVPPNVTSVTMWPKAHLDAALAWASYHVTARAVESYAGVKAPVIPDCLRDFMTAYEQERYAP